MELKNFIKTVLNDILTAVSEAQSENKTKSTIVSPLGIVIQNHIGIKCDNDGQHHQDIEFDIAVYASKSSNIEGKCATEGIIKVCGVSAELDGALEHKNSTTNRIKFHVPIALECTSKKETKNYSNEFTRR